MEEFNDKLTNAAPVSDISEERQTETDPVADTELVQLRDEDVEQKVYYKELTPTRMVLRRFFRSRLSVVGLVMIVALFVFAFLGPPIGRVFG